MAPTVERQRPGRPAGSVAAPPPAGTGRPPERAARACAAGRRGAAAPTSARPFCEHVRMPRDAVRTAAAPPAARGPHRDTARTRRLILDAAERLLTQRGGAVPTYEVARAAGVGQATLYRHFPERSALVAAVLERRLDALETLAARHPEDPACALTLLRTIAGQQASSAAILEVLHESCGRDALEALGERTRRLIAGPIATATAAGLLRPDFGVDDFLLVLCMVDGVLERGEPAERAARAERTLELVLGGVLR
jgi:AcrR family transcriptional regulator